MRLFRKRPQLPQTLGETLSASARPMKVPGSFPGSSIIGRNTRFRGEIRGRGPLVVRGQVEGKVGIEDRLIVEREGRLDAEGNAGELVVSGSASGDLQARGTLILASTGVLEGRIQANRLRVEEGGILRGTVARNGSGS